MDKTYVCFVSGGRDSALACYIAYERARDEGAGFRLIFIDTGTGLRTTKEYVHEYARWLNADLYIVETPFRYWDLVKRYGYPLLFKYRWCMDFLKKVPLGMVAYSEAKEGIAPVWVMGIRRGESLFRLSEYTREWYTYTVTVDPKGCRYCLPRFTRRYWCPILNLSDRQRDEMLKRVGVPENPVWREVGISGECLCLAGTTRRTLDRLIAFMRDHEPDLLESMVQMDEEVQRNRRRADPTYPAPLLRVRKTLSEYIKSFPKRNVVSYNSIANQVRRHAV